MGKYLIRRLLIGAVTLLALATVTFFLMHAVPGFPFTDETGKLSAGVKSQVVEQYGLDKPIHIQYVKYLGNAIRGEFGISLYRNGREVTDIIKTGVSKTVSLGIVAFCIALGIGILLGVVAAISKHRWVKHSVSAVTTIGISIPSFLLALLMMLLFGVVLRVLPTVGLSTWKHYIMPSVALAMAPIAMISRLTENSLEEVMKQDYMMLARSKGTGQFMLILRHALKNSMVPVITYAGPLLASLLTGSFVVETLFSIPGIGAEFVMSIANRDYTMIMALTIFYGTLIIVCNIVTDMITVVLDPRIRLK